MKRIKIKDYLRLFVIAVSVVTVVGLIVYSPNIISYFNGEKVETKNVSVEITLEQKAENGDVKAQSAIAARFELKKDYKNALEWYERAANRNHGLAYNQLGIFYEQGLGVKKDIQKAMFFYKKAGDSGYAPGYYNLSRFSVHPEYGTNNPTQQKELLTKAAEMGDVKSQIILSKMFAQDQEGFNEEKARYWLEKAANGGNAEAQYILSVLLKDEGTDYERSSDLLLRSAGGNDKNALKIANKASAVCRQADSAVKKIHVAYCFIAAKQGDHVAQNVVGGLYHSGTFVEKDIDKAMSYYLQSANQGNLGAITLLVIEYWKGRALPKDQTMSYAWLLVFEEISKNPEHSTKNVHKLKKNMSSINEILQSSVGFFEKLKAKRSAKRIINNIKNKGD